MYKELETDRLFISPITKGGSNFFYQLVNTQGWLKFIGDRNIRNTHDVEEYLQKIIENAYHISGIRPCLFEI